MSRKKRLGKKNTNKPKINLKKAASIANDALEFCRSGNYERGIILLHKAEERTKNNDQIFLNLAIAYHATRQFSQARKYYAKAIRAKPDNVLRVLQGGINDLAINKLTSAECCIGAVYDVDPTNITARLARGSIELRKNNRFEGAKIMRECYQTEPKMTSAVMELAEFGELTLPDIELIETNIKAQITDDKNKKFLLLALAKGYENLGNFTAAFTKYSEAQELFAHTSATTNYQAVTDLEGHYSVLKENITKLFVEEHSNLSDAGEDMIFVVGLPKSGLHEASFLLQQSEEADICGELNWCNEKIYQMLQANDNDFAKTISTINKDMIVTLVEDYKSLIQRRVRSNKIIVNCKSTNFVNIWLIKILFPKAKIVYAKRHLEDQILVTYFNNAVGMEYLNDLFFVGKYVIAYGKVMDLWQNLYPQQIVTFDYDAFIQQPQPVYSKLLCDLGLNNKELPFTSTSKPSLNITEIYRPAQTIAESYKEFTNVLDTLLQPESSNIGLNFENFNLDNTSKDDSLNLTFGKDNDDSENPLSSEGFKLKF